MSISYTYVLNWTQYKTLHVRNFGDPQSLFVQEHELDCHKYNSFYRYLRDIYAELWLVIYWAALQANFATFYPGETESISDGFGSGEEIDSYPMTHGRNRVYGILKYFDDAIFEYGIGRLTWTPRLEDYWCNSDGTQPPTVAFPPFPSPNAPPDPITWKLVNDRVLWMISVFPRMRYALTGSDVWCIILDRYDGAPPWLFSGSLLYNPLMYPIVIAPTTTKVRITNAMGPIFQRVNFNGPSGDFDVEVPLAGGPVEVLTPVTTKIIGIQGYHYPPGEWLGPA